MTASEVEQDPLDLERRDPAMLLPDDGQIQRAIASVPGVAAASVRRDQRSGRTRLRLKLKAGEDAEQAAWSVAATLRERFGIALDPAAIRPVLLPESAEETPSAPTPEPAVSPIVRPDPSAAHRARPQLPPPPTVAARAAAFPRATIARLDIERGEQQVEVTVALRCGSRMAEGVARAAPTARSVLRAAAEATAASLQQLTAAPLLIAVDRIDVEPAADPAHALVVLTVMADRGEEELVGVSLVRGQPERAVVRATLDACNRRIEPLLAAGPAEPPVLAG